MTKADFQTNIGQNRLRNNTPLFCSFIQTTSNIKISCSSCIQLVKWISLSNQCTQVYNVHVKFFFLSDILNFSSKLVFGGITYIPRRCSLYDIVLTQDTGMLLSEIQRPKNKNGVHINRPKAHTRGSARGFILLNRLDASAPKATPMNPAATVMPPKMKAMLE